MQPEQRKIERFQSVENFGKHLSAELKKRGVILSVVGENGLRIQGELTASEKEIVKTWKRQLINAISPKCSKCGSVMELIENGKLWFCRLGCGSKLVI